MTDEFISSSNSGIADLRLIQLPRHVDNNCVLTVLESKVHVPFQIARIFTLQAPTGAIRGMHAHRRCAQFMICPQGAVRITCNDGSDHKSFLLDTCHIGLFVPPKIWAFEVFTDVNSLLIVVCDRQYEADDYIRDYYEFLTFKGCCTEYPSR
jgi:dTDP-4-dehydrorhamnose 3,5-epimerase-like enzyme